MHVQDVQMEVRLFSATTCAVLPAGKTRAPARRSRTSATQPG